MKSILPLLLLTFLIAFTSRTLAEPTHVAVIRDSDGFTNVRQGKGTGTQIVARINADVRFFVEPSSDTWWQVRTSDGTTGYIYNDRVRILGPIAGTTKSATDQRARPASTASSAVSSQSGGHFSPGFRPPGSGATDTERFLYQLHRITMSYYLAATYQTAIGNDVYTDAHWALGRGIAVRGLLESESANRVPSSVTDFCAEAIELDRALQVIARARANAGPAAADDVRNIFIGGTGDSSRRTGGALLKAIVRDGQVRQMARALLVTKQSGNFHQEWEEILSHLAAREPALRQYAADPQFTDSTWHFMRAKEMGDVYPGESASTRGPRQLYINRPVQIVHIGSLSDRPILLRVNKRGSFNWEITVDMAPGPGPITQAECTRGHFGYQLRDFSTWAARGLNDFHREGRFDRSAPKHGSWGGRLGIQIYHMSTGASGDEDAISEGTLLIYRRDQANSDDEARRIARVVDL